MEHFEIERGVASAGGPGPGPENQQGASQDQLPVIENGAEDPLAADTFMELGGLTDADHDDVIAKAKRRRLLPGAAVGRRVQKSSRRVQEGVVRERALGGRAGLG